MCNKNYSRLKNLLYFTMFKRTSQISFVTHYVFTWYSVIRIALRHTDRDLLRYYYALLSLGGLIIESLLSYWIKQLIFEWRAGKPVHPCCWWFDQRTLISQNQVTRSHVLSGGWIVKHKVTDSILPPTFLSFIFPLSFHLQMRLNVHGVFGSLRSAFLLSKVLERCAYFQKIAGTTFRRCDWSASSAPYTNIQTQLNSAVSWLNLTLLFSSQQPVPHAGLRVSCKEYALGATRIQLEFLSPFGDTIDKINSSSRQRLCGRFVSYIFDQLSVAWHVTTESTNIIRLTTDGDNHRILGLQVVYLITC